MPTRQDDCRPQSTVSWDRACTILLPGAIAGSNFKVVQKRLQFHHGMFSSLSRLFDAVCAGF